MKRIIWQSRDGLTHLATVLGDDLDGYEIRSDCGLASEASWYGQLSGFDKITCLRCRHKQATMIPTMAARAA